MSFQEILLWLAPALVLLAAGWLWLRRATAPRVRPPEPKRFPRAEVLRWDHVATPVAPPVPPDHVASIRREAEASARRTTATRAPEPPNPYPVGTRECVLWATSFHLAMTELAERALRPSGPTPL